jgi:simple sugar transport system ATP-binding protein
LASSAVPEQRVVAPASADDDVLRVEHMTKSFGPTTALRDVSLHLRKGEVLGLLGDNGAGKSTLVKIICGFQKQDSGTMWLKGHDYAPKSVQDARQQGVDVVYQDLALVDELSVYQNMFLGREPRLNPLPLINTRRMKAEARRALNDIGINLPRLDVSVAVARGVYSEGADVLLLDEPLAAMGAKEGAMILELIARLKAEGNLSIMMILHNYTQVLQSCDRVNMIVDGIVALDKPTSETSLDELNEIVIEEYKRARAAAQAEEAADAARAAAVPE